MKNILRLSLLSLITALFLSACFADDEKPAADTPVSTVSQAILTAESNGAIPKLNHDDTLLGPDTDGNGIRDDIDAYIATLPYTEVQKKAIQQDARALTATLIIDINDSVALKTAGEKVMQAVNCVFDKFDLQTADQVTNDMEKITINTKNRFIQYEKYNSARSGSVTRLPDGDTCEQ